MTPEGKVEAYLVRRVKETGGRQRKLQWIGQRGGPDRMVWWPKPRMAFVEVKHRTGRLSVLQEREHARLRADGFDVYVVWDEADVDNFIAEMTKEG